MVLPFERIQINLVLFAYLFVPLHRLRRSRRDSLAALKQAARLYMNWIILILAGLCEVGFTYCLGRAKGISGTEYLVWMS